MQFVAETESLNCYISPSPEPVVRRGHRGAGDQPSRAVPG